MGLSCTSETAYWDLAASEGQADEKEMVQRRENNQLHREREKNPGSQYHRSQKERIPRKR